MPRQEPSLPAFVLRFAISGGRDVAIFVGGQEQEWGHLRSASEARATALKFRHKSRWMASAMASRVRFIRKPARILSGLPDRNDAMEQNLSLQN
jgi:hypothetical protein